MICQRPAHKARRLLWEFVGGKVESGETKEQALWKSIRIYAFDNITAYVPLLHRNKSFYPYLDETQVPPYRYGMLNRSTIPILAVLGTSSKQGKFTLQLHISRYAGEQSNQR